MEPKANKDSWLLKLLHIEKKNTAISKSSTKTFTITLLKIETSIKDGEVNESTDQDWLMIDNPSSDITTKTFSPLAKKYLSPCICAHRRKNKYCYPHSRYPHLYYSNEEENNSVSEENNGKDGDLCEIYMLFWIYFYKTAYSTIIFIASNVIQNNYNVTKDTKILYSLKSVLVESSIDNNEEADMKVNILIIYHILYITKMKVIYLYYLFQIV